MNLTPSRFVALALMLVGCAPLAAEDSRTVGSGELTAGPLPGQETEIGKLARNCSKPRYCGAIGYVDCNSAVDGPAYYFERQSGKIVGRCGGFCMARMKECAETCPPPGWTCRPDA